MTSYSNPGGVGDRTASIIVTHSPGLFTLGTDIPAHLVNGARGTTDALTFNAGVSDGWIKFDFGIGATKVIDGFVFWQLGSISHGLWQWLGSHDDLSYTPLGSAFELHGATPPGPSGSAFEFNEPAGNNAGYRYYMLAQATGATQAYKVAEFEFRIGEESSEPASEPSESPSEPPPFVTPDYGNPGGTGDRRSLIWLSVGHVPDTGNLVNLLNGDVGTNQVIFTGGDTDAYLIFDFGPTGFKQVIDGFKWYESLGNSQGTWAFEGSQDAVTWTAITSVGLGGTAPVNTYSFANTTAYRFYRLRQTAGSTSSSTYNRGIEFRIGAGSPILEELPTYRLEDFTGLITVTTDATLTGPGTIENLVNGNIFAGDPPDTGEEPAIHFGDAQTLRHIKFDFGSPVLINEAKWYQSGNNSQGQWQWYVSNDDASYTPLGVPLTLRSDVGGTPFVYNHFDGNTRGWRYYDFRQVSGSTNFAPAIQEIEFRLLTDFAPEPPTEPPSEPPTGTGSEPPSEPPLGTGSEPPSEPPTGTGSEPPSEPVSEPEPAPVAMLVIQVW